MSRRTAKPAFRTATRAALLVLIVLIPAGVVLIIWPPAAGRQSRQEFLAELTADIRAAEPLLRDYAADVRRGAIAEGPPSRWHAAKTTQPTTAPSGSAARRLPRGFKDPHAPVHPLMDTRVYRRILTVAADANANVYFVLRESDVFSNCGFVLRNGRRKLLGDGVEPTIRETVHLFGDWWFYRAS